MSKTKTPREFKVRGKMTVGVVTKVTATSPAEAVRVARQLRGLAPDGWTIAYADVVEAVRVDEREAE